MLVPIMSKASPIEQQRSQVCLSLLSSAAIKGAPPSRPKPPLMNSIAERSCSLTNIFGLERRRPPSKKKMNREPETGTIRSQGGVLRSRRAEGTCFCSKSSGWPRCTSLPSAMQKIIMTPDGLFQSNKSQEMSTPINALIPNDKQAFFFSLSIVGHLFLSKMYLGTIFNIISSIRRVVRVNYSKR